MTLRLSRRRLLDFRQQSSDLLIGTPTYPLHITIDLGIELCQLMKKAVFRKSLFHPCHVQHIGLQNCLAFRKRWISQRCNGWQSFFLQQRFSKQACDCIVTFLGWMNMFRETSRGAAKAQRRKC